ncbi:MAG TPA: MmgE/PrpD family protein [Burkholderiales bacterium]|nr:MmgE/PrpD family protein [Burkholderiales bacterium]
MPEITRTLARFVVDSHFIDLPAHVRHAGTRAFLNWFGCAIGGSRHETVERAWAARSGFAGEPQVTLIARGGRTDLLTGACMNGIAAHVFDFDDGQPRNTNINPSAAVAPAPLALGEHLKSRGADVLHAFILGLEVECRIANAVYATDNARWFTNSTTGVFGAAAAAGKLLGLDERQMTWALGIAATQSSGLRISFGNMCKSFNCGRAAENGLLAALLAQRGFTSSDRAIEAPRGFAQVFLPGSDPSPIVERLGAEYEVTYAICKPFACGVVLHAAIDACIRARETHGFDPRWIEKVVLRVHPIVTQITAIREPATGLESKFSVFHVGALGLLDGAAGEAQFSDRRAADADVIALRRKVEAVPEPAFRRDQAHVRVVMQDGSAFETHVEHAIGTLQNPLTDAALEAKFRSLAAGILEERESDAAIDLCWHLEALDDFSHLPRTAAGRMEETHV